MADVSESKTGTCVQKGQPNYGVRRRSLRGEGDVAAWESSRFCRSLTDSQKENSGSRRGQSWVRWPGYEETRPKCVTEFHKRSSVCENKEQNILALDGINNWKSDYCSSSITLKRNSSSAVLCCKLPERLCLVFGSGGVFTCPLCPPCHQHQTAGLTWPT